jgi:UDP:flavonoid glycosyltransferase YjiC (YdhE family)
MRLLLTTLGSRGDVEPFALLAEALAARGHDVVLLLDPGHHEGRPEMPRVSRVALGKLDGPTMADIVRQALGAPPGERAFVARRRFFDERADAVLARVRDLVTTGGFDWVVASEWLLGAAPETSRRALVLHTPAPRSEFLRLGRVPALRLAALSRALGADDADVASAWTFTGFWIKRSTGVLPPALAACLAEGPPPLFLTMGSMVGFDATRLVTTFVEAARACGRRAFVQAGWAGLADTGAISVGEVDYAALFPRCAAIFHHGGTGTSAHALHAGRPVALLPIVDDQVFFARTLARIGASVATLDPFAPVLEDFTAALRRALADPRAQGAAAELARRLRGEAGLSAACVALERA